MIDLVQQLSFNVRSSIVWSVAADIVRFHGKRRDIRISVVRPHQYFCVRIRSQKTDSYVLFNLLGTSALVQGPTMGGDLYPDHPPGHYLRVALREGSRILVEETEKALGLQPHPAKPEPTTPATLCVRAIARLMRDRALWTEPLIAESGYDADDWGVSVNSFVEYFAEVQAKVTAADDDAKPEIANRIWCLRRATKKEQVVLDFKTAEAVVPGGRRESLWALFEKNDRKLAPVVAWLDERL